MKRILILASGALLCSVAYALAATDYQVAVVDDVSYHDLVKVNILSPITVDYLALNDADLLAPNFNSNFCELVKFPELGSLSVCDGYTAVARGPPKGQTNLSQLTLKKPCPL